MAEFSFADLQEGMTASFSRTITEKDLDAFSQVSGDHNPLHMDAAYAATTPFKQRVAFGLLVQSTLSTLAGMHLPGKYSLILSTESDFRKPTFIGDELHVQGTVLQKVALGNIIIVETKITNQRSETVLTGKMRIRVTR